ncbi:Uncharacterized protein APZ42_031050 [Daphnia magna]|uniref:DUF5641 domain-containing protein n=1 Tax=Daphnia magna TaxID=35525 RepID=A0A164N6N2_9CRUS|nr:Uncharacterized protein APZ42_031050 [Daphnia magna]
MALTNAEQANGTFATPNQQTHQGTNTPSIQYAGYGVSYTLQNPANQATTTTLPSHINAQQGLATSTPLNGKGITCGQYGPHWGTTPHQTQPTQLQLTTYPTMSSNGCHPTTPLNNTALDEKTKRAQQEQAMQAFGSVTIFCDRQRYGRSDDWAAHLESALDLGHFEEARKLRLMRSKLDGEAAEEFDTFKVRQPYPIPRVRSSKSTTIQTLSLDRNAVTKECRAFYKAYPMDGILDSATAASREQMMMDRRGSVSIMYSDNAQTFRCVSKNLKVLRSDPAIHDLLAMRKTECIFSASLAPWWGGFWESMVRTIKDLLRRSNGRACLKYDELEVSLIETDSVVNARPLTYVAEGSDDPLPITPNQFLNNRPSNCTPVEPAKNLMAPDATNLKLLEMDRQRREYVSDICERFVTDYFLQIDKLHCKGGPGRKIRVGEVVIIHDDNTKRLMWTIGVVKELVTSRNGLIRSVMVKTPNGNLINHAIQSLHPLELREDKQDDVEISPTPELELEPEEATPPVAAADPVEQEEPWTTGSGGECVGNIPRSQHPTTRAGRRTRLPSRFNSYDLGGPR